jgi:hypothetical protein
MNEEYTNKEFYDFIHPWSEVLPYTYDTWDFDYCSEQGYPFTASTTENDAAVPSNKNNNLVPPTITNSIGVPSKK